MGQRLRSRIHGWLLSAVVAAVALGATHGLHAQIASAPTSSAADLALLERVLSQVGANAVVKAEFIQTRTSPLLATPVITRGTLVFASELGVIWQVSAPQWQGYVYGRQRTARFDADGNVLSREAQPSALTHQINEWASAFTHGDVSGLASQFAISATGTTSRWQAVLTPSQPQIAQAMRRLTLTGDNVVRTVVLETQRGESIRWQFDKVKTSEPLNARERRLFRAAE
ncbi:hypothetical protein UC34_13685 [Pandoraea vervacti]|uniref:Uncharacterized protein n=1 Tax=Pandoraea vervacti TaxID=656178 RepID=A0ABN4FQ73_9BURK|nr:outer membrane lipoprotein carrier protein LolA [Pandoraea vervacti]AJP57746.1 hypothetical protein UC34_13685 [Pandoraea vervacti]